MSKKIIIAYDNECHIFDTWEDEENKFKFIKNCIEGVGITDTEFILITNKKPDEDTVFYKSDNLFGRNGIWYHVFECDCDCDVIIKFKK